jgi:DNA polymerase-3 subunit gamma/tau
MKNQRLHVELTLMKLCSLLSANDPSKKKAEYAAPAAAPLKAAERTEPPAKAAVHPAAVPVSRPIPAPDAKKAAPLSRTISITQALNGKNGNNGGKDAPADATPKSEMKESFSEEKLAAAWKQYADRLAVQGKQNLYVTLSRHSPQLRDGFQVEFTVDNKVQEEELNLEKTSFLEYLRTELRNTFISLTVIVSAGADDNNNMLYTPKDKFRRMAENNPLLNDFKKQLDLEIDF